MQLKMFRTFTLYIHYKKKHFRRKKKKRISNFFLESSPLKLREATLLLKCWCVLHAVKLFSIILAFCDSFLKVYEFFSSDLTHRENTHNNWMNTYIILSSIVSSREIWNLLLFLDVVECFWFISEWSFDAGKKSKKILKILKILEICMYYSK